MPHRLPDRFLEKGKLGSRHTPANWPARVAGMMGARTNQFCLGPADSAALARAREALGSPSSVTFKGTFSGRRKDEPIDSANRPNLKMLAVRNRAACVARRARLAAVTPQQTTRSYASEHGHDHNHDHHHSPQVEESPGVCCL
jgi:hypothetical protein